jgi:hypothetical protein
MVERSDRNKPSSLFGPFKSYGEKSVLGKNGIILTEQNLGQVFNSRSGHVSIPHTTSVTG